MNIKRLLILIVPVLAMLSGCKKEEAVKKTGLVVVNVLDQDLYDDCHISGSINIPFESLEIFDSTIDKSAEIVCYCSNYFCTASGQACKYLKSKGYTKIYAYEAGMAEWYQSGLPVEGCSKSPYLHKRVAPLLEHEDGYNVITTQELAEKMKIKTNA